MTFEHTLFRSAVRLAIMPALSRRCVNSQTGPTESLVDGGDSETYADFGDTFARNLGKQAFQSLEKVWGGRNELGIGPTRIVLEHLGDENATVRHLNDVVLL